MKKCVAIAVSGGVDSSVSAYLLKKSGYNVLALFMKNWEDDPECSAKEDYHDALCVCEKLSIPLYTLNFAKEYQNLVFKKFIDDLKTGLTPNPDILCNRKIKFSLLLKEAIKLGANFLATGHYATVSADGSLFKAFDLNKDQSYFLAGVKPASLKHVIFPLSKLTKPQVRQIAKEQNLENHNKKDSTGICFIGKRNFSTFIEKYVDSCKGVIKDTSGNVIGNHNGVWHHTIGQRKGLALGGPGEAYYVYKKCFNTNTIWVCQGKNHDALFSKELTTDAMHWLGPFPRQGETLMAKIRYRCQDQPCSVVLDSQERATINFKTPQRAVAPGQLAVIYRDTQVIGSAVIASSL